MIYINISESAENSAINKNINRKVNSWFKTNVHEKKSKSVAIKSSESRDLEY
uniref:Uncharacterized protein n=1 Tax=Ciona intestinalis TaxID=7719 RepID=H2XQW0_CIOIN